LSETATDCWTGGLPTTTLPRTLLLVAAGNMTIPLALPTAVFSSTRLLSPLRIPMPKSSFGLAKPFPLVSFHRSELLDPIIHIPPQANPGVEVPFLTEMLDPSVILEERAFTRIPDWQFVEDVIPSTLPSRVPAKRTPLARNRRTTPGPRISTSACPLVLM